jgi:hypothetical protein
MATEWLKNDRFNPAITDVSPDVFNKIRHGNPVADLAV